MGAPPDWRARLHEIAERHGLEAPAEEALARLLGLLRDDDRAPTTVRDPRSAVDVQVADSLAGLEVEAVRRARRLADLGAGAGFPGLPLAVALPEASVSLVESVRRKCGFLERAAAVTGAANVSVACTRAEEWRAEPQDVVCARAVAPLATLVEYAAPLLVDGGAFVAWKGARDAREESEGAAAAGIVGLEPSEVRRARPYEASERRHLYVYLKVRSTPTRFPRRTGMARKRPLSA